MSDLKVIGREYQVLWNNEKSGAVVLKYGDVGIMWDIRGEDFYKFGKDCLREAYERLDIDRLEGYISLAHVRLMERMLRDVAIVRQMHPGLYHGKPSMWVSVELRHKC